MDRYQTVYTIEESFKVKDLDEALRSVKRDYNFPWSIKKSTLKIINGVNEYSVPTDFKDLAYLDNSKSGYGNKARFVYTSLQQFYEDAGSRNKLCLIWDGDTKILGAKYDEIPSSVILNNAETASDWTASGDASGITLDSVTYKEGNGSIRFTITSSTGVANIVNTLTSISDSDYRKKYHRKWIYLSSVPTSIELILRSSDGNYLTTTLTSQFSGQAFKANDWNLIAQNLDTATEVGTFDETTISSEEVIINGATTGTYFIDSSYMSGWDLLDFWYYSKYSVSSDGITANQEYFIDSSESYDVDYYLTGDDEFSDVIMFEALATALSDKENDKLKADIEKKRNAAWLSLFNKYPDMVPVIITKYYNLTEDFQYENLEELT